MRQSVTNRGRILVCGGTSDISDATLGEWSALGWTVDVVGDAEQAFASLDTGTYDVCFVNALLEASAPALASRIAAIPLVTRLFVLAPSAGSYGPDETNADASKGIAFLATPREVRAALLAASEHTALEAENRRLKLQLHSRLSQDVIGHSDAVEHLREIIRQTSDDDGPLLLEGELGTEAAAIARAIHTYSRRAHRSFRAFDCSVLSSECLQQALFGTPPESEFGSCEGDIGHEGCFEAGDCGTLLLENLDHVALPLQKRLAAALAKASIPAGEPSARGSALRLIATTHTNLSELCDQNRFRPDLLNLFGRTSVTVPPLRHRREDISPLTEHFLKLTAQRHGRSPKRLTLDGLEMLKSYDWHGNVLELQNVIERACMLDNGQRLTGDMLSPWLTGSDEHEAADFPGMTLKEMERQLIETTFARYGGNRERTARSLRIGVRTLSGKLREYGYPPRGGPGSNVVIEHRKAA